MSKEQSGKRPSRVESSIDVPDASHSYVSNATFGNLPKNVPEDGSRLNKTKVKSGTRRSQGLMMLLAFLSIYSLLQEKNILHSVKMTSLELVLEEAVTKVDTDAFPMVTPYAYPTSPSISSKGGMSVSDQDQDQAETEIATSQVELEHQYTSVEEEAEQKNQEENKKELEDPGQAETEIATSQVELERQDTSAEEEAEQKNQEENKKELEDPGQAETEIATSQVELERQDASVEQKDQQKNRRKGKSNRERTIKCTRQGKNWTLDQLASHPWRPG
jgi:hypothetical protein